MKKFLASSIVGIMLLSTTFASGISAENIEPNAEDELYKANKITETITDINSFEHVNPVIETTPKDPNSMTTSSLPHFEHTEGGGTIGSPAQIDSDRMWIRDEVTGYASTYYLEYTIKDGNLILFENEGFEYYTQGWTQSYFNMVTGYMASLTAATFLAKGTYQISGKSPYLTKVYDKYKNVIKDYGGYVTGSAAMIALSSPIFNTVNFASIPTAGTKEVIVYVKRVGQSNWDHRARFVISGNTLSTNTWILNN